ncbi:galactokinase [Leptolyngbya sp. AN02str]|uniref:galactokinase n=1 Tax=Leptolyngbya sp. AN02str TaxID=3423363 RepID=UPI003D31ECC3
MDYIQIFNAAAEVEAIAPGRVNLLGEHTDYNDGFVLPTAIPQQTRVAIGHSPNDRHHIYSAELEEWIDIHPIKTSHTKPEGFARYVYGCIRVLETAGYDVPPLNVFVTSAVPIGAGLSSSAALEVATLRGLRSLLHLEIDDVKIAQLGQQAEIQYAGVSCGILDQMASSLADTEHMLFLDTRTLERQIVPFPAGAAIVVIDSGVARSLAASGYNQRRAECEEAAKQLGVKALRDVPDPQAAAALPELLRKRARHVITENNRVLQARDGVAADEFGQLMNDSHASLRDDYEVSIAALDHLVELLQQTPGVFGARLTGAGFGGACVALVTKGQSEAIATHVLEAYNHDGFDGRILVV